ncbi:MAG: hypothetical protein H7Z17_10415 [Fuerstia sp.]|nr:hypothetical protein [Fuerstiella sp.]
MIQRLRPVLIALLLLSVCVSGRASADDESTRDRRHRQLLEKRQSILDAMQRDLESVRSWCAEHELPDADAEVAGLAQRILSPDVDSSPPRFVTPPVSKSLPIEDQQWQLQLRHHREERAKELYTLARSTLNAGFPSLAFMMIGDVIRIDPDHKYARSILGTELFTDPTRKDDAAYAGEWVSLFEKRMRGGNKPQVDHPKYGWIPLANVARYDEGLRPWKSNWVSVEKERELRRDFRNAWEIRSENFLVKTNVSLEEGVELSHRLEVFNHWLQQNFAAFFDTPKTLQDRFEAASSRSSPAKQNQMEVHYYATRDEYQKRVQGKVPPDLETNGLYWEDDRTSYFFDNPEKDGFSTLYHEATHQILDLATREARNTAAKARGLKLRQRPPARWKLGEKSNFWILEGIACYFESFDIESGHVSVGNPDNVRFDIARQRIVDPKFYYYLPAQQLSALGQEEFQHHPQIKQLYTQGAGFAHFLMHYEDGLYRDDLITLLSQIYRPDPDKVLEEPSLPAITGVSFELLDRQYHTHMQDLIPLTAPIGN